jgi:hypothetical protein
MSPAYSTLVDPCGATRQPPHRLAARTAVGRGSVLGILHNGKSPGDLILDKVARAAAAQLGISDVVRVRKPSAAQRCPDDLLDDLAARCSALVNGIGD